MKRTKLQILEDLVDAQNSKEECQVLHQLYEFCKNPLGILPGDPVVVGAETFHMRTATFAYYHDFGWRTTDGKWWAKASLPPDYSKPADAAVAAIHFAMHCDSPAEFLRCWNEGSFDTIREEWPEAPEEVFAGLE